MYSPKILTRGRDLNERFWALANLKCLIFGSLITNTIPAVYGDVTKCMGLSYEDMRIQSLQDSLVKNAILNVRKIIIIDLALKDGIELN